MELQEQINALNGEKKHLISMIDNLNNEKTALDQMVVNSMKEIFGIKKEVLIKDNAINHLNQQIQVLLKEKEALTKENEELKNSIHVLGAEAQSGG